jgi:hypothetical protein
MNSKNYSIIKKFDNNKKYDKENWENVYNAK